MTATAEPQELRQLATQCRSEADRLDQAVRTLRIRLSEMSGKWTGIAADSFNTIINQKAATASQAAQSLRQAASELEQGARQIDTFRAEERAREERERREREERERRERERQNARR